MTERLFLFLLALSLVTLVGHGIWVLLTKLFAAVGDRTDGLFCPRCGQRIEYREIGCKGCGLGTRGTDPARRRDIQDALNRSVQQLALRGWIDPSLVRSLSSPTMGVQPDELRCLRCGAALDSHSGLAGCQQCGLASSVSVHGRQREILAELAKTITSLEQRGLLDLGSRQALLSTIETARERLATENSAAEKLAAEQLAAKQLATGQRQLAAPDDAIILADVANSADDLVPVEIVELDPRRHMEPTGPQQDFERVRRFVDARKGKEHESVAAASGAWSDAWHAQESAPPAVRPPRRSLAEVMSVFLEQSNIRWGEIVGGLLIICCSIALVISFWAQIADRPFLKFFIFNGVTAALFGVGIYSKRKWNLESTSRGLLIIATLLVPLNFLAIAAFDRNAAVWDPRTIGGEVVSGLIFTALIYVAGQILLAHGSLALTLTVMASSILTLLARRFPGAEGFQLWLLASLPLVGYVLSNFWLNWRALAKSVLDEETIAQLLILLGLSSFAVLMPLGLLLFRSGDIVGSLRAIAPLLVVFALPTLLCGAQIWKREGGDASNWFRLSGSALTILATLVMLAGNVLAWPRVDLLLAALLLTLATTVLLIWLAKLREAHAVLAVGWSWGSLLVALLAYGSIAWNSTGPEILTALQSMPTAVILTVNSLLLFLVGWWFQRNSKHNEGLAYGSVGAINSALAFALASWIGGAVYQDTSGAVWIYLSLAVLYLAVSLLAHRNKFAVAAAWGAIALLLATSVQVVAFTYADRFEFPWITAILLHSGVCCTLAVLVQLCGRTSREHRLSQAYGVAAQVGTVVATIILAGLIWQGNIGVPALVCATLCVIWFLLATLWNSRALLVAAQYALVGGIVLGMATRWSSEPWFATALYPWILPRTLQYIGLTLVAIASVWILLRMIVSALRRRSALQPHAPVEPSISQLDIIRTNLRQGVARSGQLLEECRPRLDGALLAVSLVLLLMVSIYGVIPGLSQELSPQRRVASSLKQINVQSSTSKQSDPAANASAESSQPVVIYALPAVAIKSSETDKSSVGQMTPVRYVPPAENFELRGVPHQQALAVESWVLLAALIGAFLWSLRWEYRLEKAIGVLVAASAAVFLLSGRAEPDVAVASAMRWWSSGYLLLGSVILWARNPLSRLGQSLRLLPASSEARGSSGPLRSGMLVLSLMPLLAMTLFVAISAVMKSGLPAGGNQLLGIA
ncbi:MAG: hypothetical protein SGJ20_22340, partial [Planctomycetota bacterium]|nr:hypothetical protein [Planctomycetota bacterium]